MDFMVHTKHAPEGFCSFPDFRVKGNRNVDSTSGARFRGKVGSKSRSVIVHMGCKASLLVLPGPRPRKQRRNCVFAVSKVESFSSNGKMQHTEQIPHGHLDGTESSSVTNHSSRSFEEFECNNHLRKLVRNGELEEGFKFLESMVNQGDIPDVIACTSLIRGFCKIGKTRKATRVMDILEGSGAVPDVITYNVLISGYCKSGEIDNALRVLDRMSIAPDVVTFNTILRTLCDSGKLKQAMEVLHQQLQRELIDGLSKMGQTERAVGLLNEMRGKGLKPDIITYSSLVGGLSREGKVDEAIKFLHDLERLGVRPNAITYNSIMLGLCKAKQTSRAIDFLAYMVSRECKPTEATYTILIEGIANEGLAKEALELLNQLCSRGVVKKSSAEQVAVRM
ncbi:pentatricopeptide repeat-containing protein At1g09900 [Fagus crenata]